MIAALRYYEPIAWIPLVVLAWMLAIAADLVANGAPPLWTIVRRVAAGILTFHYVCFAWIFFRAPSFDDALAVLRQIADGDPGHANVTPMIQTVLAVGLAAHLWADGTFRWMRDRFVALPPIAQGALLAACALVLRELSSPKLVKFIYFEF
jgi:alginate O-acetyltransferase complex protein AlgI